MAPEEILYLICLTQFKPMKTLCQSIMVGVIHWLDCSCDRLIPGLLMRDNSTILEMTWYLSYFLAYCSEVHLMTRSVEKEVQSGQLAVHATSGGATVKFAMKSDTIDTVRNRRPK